MRFCELGFYFYFPSLLDIQALKLFTLLPHFLTLHDLASIRKNQKSMFKACHLSEELGMHFYFDFTVMNCRESFYQDLHSSSNIFPSPTISI